ncbi:DUF3426 domain-containing protein [Cupriavidus sp. UYPR2.512]|uniref:DUF3426 domain-containing protein n=1 Tax=Cupriavidus sp. UYPR2.512 TaxID=1080187 RepID=UPI00036436C3|nr:DUF3426 domain-containing protein [Cupriavidus sp. UYPR2.512]UIF85672.1 DUF3426 domain-containing protein [Cupriavidus necator]
MAAVKLVTRCPACRTAFRLVADQLRLRQGLVRCGQCETVFDAREHLIEIPLPTDAASSASSAPSAAALPGASPASSAPPVSADAAPAPQPAFTPTIDPGYDVPALDAPTMLMSSPEDMAMPAPAGMEDAEIEQALREANDAVAHRDARDAERQAAGPDAAEPAPVTAPEQAEDTPAQPASAPAWPALDHGALDTPAAPAAPPATAATPATPAAPQSADADAAPVAPAASIPSASEFLRAASADAGPEPTAWPEDASARPAASPAPPTVGDDDNAPDTGQPFSVTGGAVAREQTTRRWARTEAPAGPVFAPDFLRHARERERERQPRKPVAVSRSAWRVAAVVLAIAAAVQVVYLARSQLAGQFPILRPALEAACAPLGCDVPPWRDIDALRIETSQLQRQDEDGDTYQLAVTLRNLGRASTALPAIELVMTDLQDQLLLRRVLQPAEYLEPSQKAFAAQGLRAGMELPVRVRFRTQQAPANYRVLIFYP